VQTKVEDQFQTRLGFNEDGTNLGSSVLPRDNFPEQPLYQKTNVFWDWAIDLYSGEVRVPWRTMYDGTHFSQHSIFGSWWNQVSTDTTPDWEIGAEWYDTFHQNRMIFATVDTPPSVRGTTPTPTFH